ncbi:hypothetical protein ACFSC3_19320, partial [Sphingomonas floccifaciens]
PEGPERLVFGDRRWNRVAHRVGGVASMLDLPNRQTLFAILFHAPPKPAENCRLWVRERVCFGRIM